MCEHTYFGFILKFNCQECKLMCIIIENIDILLLNFRVHFFYSKNPIVEGQKNQYELWFETFCIILCTLDWEVCIYLKELYFYVMYSFLKDVRYIMFSFLKDNFFYIINFVLLGTLFPHFSCYK